MRVNPFYDSWLFLTGETGPQLGIGAWRYLLVAFFWGLIIASIVLAYRNWHADPAQRTEAHFGTWLARVAIGTMWFEGCLWKLPIPSGGFQYWLEQEAQYAAFGRFRCKSLLLSWHGRRAALLTADPGRLLGGERGIRPGELRRLTQLQRHLTLTQYTLPPPSAVDARPALPGAANSERWPQG